MLRYARQQGQLKHTISIDQRPAIVEHKVRIVDWEVVGKAHRQTLMTLNDRKSMFTLIARVKERTAEAVARSLVQLLSSFKSRIRPLSSDNGKEFTKHRDIARKMKAGFSIFHPYAS